MKKLKGLDQQIAKEQAKRRKDSLEQRNRLKHLVLLGVARVYT